MAKPNNKTKKMFAISSIMGVILMSANNGEPKLTALKLQIDKAMRVFSVKAPKQYYTISSDVKKLWWKMAEEHNNTLDEDEISVFIEMVANLVPKSDFKAFLGVSTYKTTEKLRDSKKSALLMSVLELDKELNKMFNTKQTATRDSLGLVITKPIKATKTKESNRDKAKPKALKMIRNRVKYNKRKMRERAVV